jgi:ornithine carbamoyltransferase
MSKTPRHFLDLSTIPTSELRSILDAASVIKKELKGGNWDSSLANKTLAMIFEKPSTRTRVSFDVGMRQLGGEAIMLTGAEMQLGRGETIADTARVLSRYVDAIIRSRAARRRGSATTTTCWRRGHMRLNVSASICALQRRPNSRRTRC